MSEDRNKREIARRRIALGLEMAAWVFLAAVISNWMTGGYKFQVIGIKVSVKEWEKPFGLFVLMMVLWMAVSPGPMKSVALLEAVLKRAVAFLKMDLSPAWSGWAAWGIAAGAAAGYLFGVDYSYLTPFYYLPALVVAAAATGAAAHIIYFILADGAFSTVKATHSAEKAGALRQGIYFLFWAGMAYGPFRNWEPRLTEPVAAQLFWGAALGVPLIWFALVNRSLKGRFGLFRRIIRTTAATLFVIYLIFAFLAGHYGSPPNVVLLITIDTVRADRLSCYGYDKLTTPNLDKLAKEGVLFKNAFCPFGTTEPSHASILTGVHPRTHGIMRYHQKVTGDVSSLAERFADKGYVTAAVTSRQKLLPDDMGIPGFQIQSGPHDWALQSSAQDAFRRAANIIARHEEERLFFWVHFFDPHKPYDFRPGFSEPFVNKDRGPRDPDGFLKADQNYSAKEIEYINALYDGEVNYMDYYIGKLLDLAHPSLTIVIADHGEVLGELQDTPLHYGFGHGGLIANPVIHVPLIIAGRDVPSGRVINDIVESTDLAQTIMDLLFQEEFPGQGLSLVPLMRGGGKSDGLAVATRYIIEDDELRPWLKLSQYALIAGGWKASIIGLPGQEVYELYDMKSDWLDQKNLAADNPGEVEKMKKEYEVWLSRTPESRPEERELSPREIQNLKALGYIQ